MNCLLFNKVGFGQHCLSAVMAHGVYNVKDIKNLIQCKKKSTETEQTKKHEIQIH